MEERMSHKMLQATALLASIALAPNLADARWVPDGCAPGVGNGGNCTLIADPADADDLDQYAGYIWQCTTADYTPDQDDQICCLMPASSTSLFSTCGGYEDIGEPAEPDFK